MADGDHTALAERIERLGRRASGTLTASDEARAAIAKARAALQSIKDGDGDGMVRDGTPQEGPASSAPAAAPEGKIKIHPAVAKALGAAGAAHLQALIDAKAPSPAIMAALRPAAQEAADIEPTLAEGEMPTPEFWAKRSYQGGKKLPETVDSLVDVAKAYAGKGGVLTEKKAVLVVGAPAAGKSTFAERMATENHAAIWDADDAKKVIPEYADGLGASAVHEESKAITAMVGARLLDEGDNIIHPIVGHDIAKTKALIDKLRSKGYEVDVVHVYVQPDEALRRMASRYVSTGRLIDPDYFRDVADKPGRVYSFLRDHGDLKDGYAEIDANGAKGQERVREAVDAPRGVQEEQPLHVQSGSGAARVADAMPGGQHRHVGAGHRVSKGFDPGKHPRDKDGKWTDGWLKGLFPGKSAIYAPPKYQHTPQFGGFWGGSADHQVAADLHTARDDKGNEVWISHPHQASPDASWSDPEAVATFVPGQKAMPAELNGTAMTPWTPPATKEGWGAVEGQDPMLDAYEPPLEVPKGHHAGAGVIVLEDDGRVWLCSPTNGYGGYRNTFPKGTIEPEISPQANAIKEAYEETGLKVSITGVLGDFKRTQSTARFYLARRTGGTPKAMGWESQAVRLAPVHALRKLLNNSTVDHPIVQALENYFGGYVAKGFNPNQPRWPAGTPLGGKWMGTGASGLTMPPHIAWNKENTGPGSNAKYFTQATKLHDAASSGDWKTVQDFAANGQEAIDKFQSGAATSSHDKWKAQVAQYAQHLAAENGQKVVVEAKAEKAGGIPNISDWKVVGKKPGGTNPGAIYEDESGTKWLVKGNKQGANDERARNEVLAAKLMAAAGIPAPDIKLVDLHGKDGFPTHNGGLGVAVRYIDQLEPIANKGWAKGQVQDQFAVHAWLANYDVIGTGTDVGGSDNMMFDPKADKVLNVDPGGAILYRAMGTKKTDFGPSVTNWDTMRDPQFKHPHAFFGDMTASQLAQSAQHVEAVTPDTINSLVKSSGLPGSVALTLIARREDVLKRAGLQKSPLAKGDPDALLASQVVAALAPITAPTKLEKPTIENPSFGAAPMWLDQIEKMHAAGDVVSLKALGMKGGVDASGNLITTTGGQYSSMFGANLSDLHTSPTVAAIVGYQKAAIADLESKVATNPAFEADHPRGEGGKFSAKPGEHPWPGHLQPPTFGGDTSKYYAGLIDKAAEAYTAGDYDAMTGLAYKHTKSGAAYAAWPKDTINGKAMTQWHSALLADMKPAVPAAAKTATSHTIQGWQGLIAKNSSDADGMKAVLEGIAKDPHLPQLAKTQLVDHAMKSATGAMTAKDVEIASLNAAWLANGEVPTTTAIKHTYPYTHEALMGKLQEDNKTGDYTESKHFVDQFIADHPALKAWAQQELADWQKGAAAPGAGTLPKIEWKNGVPQIPTDTILPASTINFLLAAKGGYGDGVQYTAQKAESLKDAIAAWEGTAPANAVAPYMLAYLKALQRYHKTQAGESTPLIVSTGDAGALDHLTTPKAVSGAEPDWEKAKTTATSGGNKSHNPKVDTIKNLYDAGDHEGILSLSYSTNTYGKKQAKLANDALAALGYGDYKVVPGQGKGEHPGTPGMWSPQGIQGQETQGALLAEGAAIHANSAQKNIKITVADLPPKPDFYNYNGPGKPYSSKPWKNQQNQEAVDNIEKYALTGDLAGLKNLAYPEKSDTEEGALTGKMIPYGEAKSAKVSQYHEDVVNFVQDKLFPPKPLEPAKTVKSGDAAAVAAAFTPVPLLVTVDKLPQNQQVGFWAALGVVQDPSKLMPAKTSPIVKHSDLDYELSASKKTWSADTKAFVASIQANAGVSKAYREGKSTYQGHNLSKMAESLVKDGFELPEGTTIYRWQHQPSGMNKALLNAPIGTVMQATGSMCASKHPTATNGFGPNRIIFIAAKGAKVVPSYATGQYGGEEETSTLPGQRLVLLKKPTPNSKGGLDTTVLMLPMHPKTHLTHKQI